MNPTQTTLSTNTDTLIKKLSNESFEKHGLQEKEIYEEHKTIESLMTHAALGEWIEVKKLIEDKTTKIQVLPKKEESENDIFHCAAYNISESQGKELEALFWVVDCFLNLGFFPTYGDHSCTAIHHLACYKETENSRSLMEKLLEKAESKDINSYNGYGETPLLKAIEAGNYSIAKLLICHQRQDFGKIRIEATEPLSEYGYYTPVGTSAYIACYYHERYEIRDLISQSNNFRQYKPNVELSRSKIKARDILVAGIPHPLKFFQDSYISQEILEKISGDDVFKKSFLTFIKTISTSRNSNSRLAIAPDSGFKNRLKSLELEFFWNDAIKYHQLITNLESLLNYQSTKKALEILNKYFSPTTAILGSDATFETVQEILYKPYRSDSQGTLELNPPRNIGILLSKYYQMKIYLNLEIKNFKKISKLVMKNHVYLTFWNQINLKEYQILFIFLKAKKT